MNQQDPKTRYEAAREALLRHDSFQTADSTKRAEMLNVFFDKVAVPYLKSQGEEDFDSYRQEFVDTYVGQKKKSAPEASLKESSPVSVSEPEVKTTEPEPEPDIFGPEKPLRGPAFVQEQMALTTSAEAADNREIAQSIPLTEPGTNIQDPGLARVIEKTVEENRQKAKVALKEFQSANAHFFLKAEDYETITKARRKGAYDDDEESIKILKGLERKMREQINARMHTIPDFYDLTQINKQGVWVADPSKIHEASNKLIELMGKPGYYTRELAYEFLKADVDAYIFAEQLKSVIKEPLEELTKNTTAKVDSTVAADVGAAEAELQRVYSQTVKTIEDVSESLHGQYMSRLDSLELSLKEQVRSGEITPEQAHETYNAASKEWYDAYVKEQSAFSSRLARDYNKQVETVGKQVEKAVTAALAGVDEEYQAEVIEILKRGENEVVETIENQLQDYDEASVFALGLKDMLYRSTFKSLGRQIAAYGKGARMSGMVVLGDEMANKYSHSSSEIADWSDMLDITKMTLATGELLGSAMSSIAVGATVGALTGGTATPAIVGLGATAFAGWLTESMDITNQVYRDKLAQTGSQIEAENAKSQAWLGQSQIMWAYALDGLPFVGKALRFLPIGPRVAAGALSEIVTETVQESMQGAQEMQIANTGKVKGWTGNMTSDHIMKTFRQVSPSGLLGIAGQVSAMGDSKGGSTEESRKRAIINIAAAMESNSPLQHLAHGINENGVEFVIASMFAQKAVAKLSNEQLQAGVRQITEAANLVAEAQSRGLTGSDVVTYVALKEAVMSAEALTSREGATQTDTDALTFAKNNLDEFLVDNTKGSYMKVTLAAVEGVSPARTVVLSPSEAKTLFEKYEVDTAAKVGSVVSGKSKMQGIESVELVGMDESQALGLTPIEKAEIPEALKSAKGKSAPKAKTSKAGKKKSKAGKGKVDKEEAEASESTETEETEEEAAERLERESQEAYERIWGTDPQEIQKRRDEGGYTLDGVRYDRQEKRPDAPRGKTAKVRYAHGVEVDATFTLREAKELQPAHKGGRPNPMHMVPEAQPKDRRGTVSQARSDEIGRNPRGEFLGENTDAYSGAPTVNERGEAIQGNNRLEGILKHYSQGLKQYKKWLADNAERFGLTREQVESMENPVLVREHAVSDKDMITLGNYRQSDIESASETSFDPLRVSRRMTPAHKARLMELATEDSQKTTNANIRANLKDIVRLLEMYIQDGQGVEIRKGSATGIADIETLLEMFLFEGHPHDLQVIFNESLSHDARRAVQRAMQYFLGLPKEKSILPDLHQAFRIIQAFVGHNSKDQTVLSFVRLPNMFDGGRTLADKYSSLAVQLAHILTTTKGQLNMVQEINKYVIQAMGQDSNMFEDAIAPKSKAEAVEAAYGIKYKPAADTSAEAAAEAETGGQAETEAEAETETETETEAEVDAKADEAPAKPKKEPRKKTKAPKNSGPSEKRVNDAREVIKKKRESVVSFVADTLKTLAKAIRVEVVFDQAEFDAKVKELNADEDARGFFFEGKVYLNPRRVTRDTAVHEFAHIYIEHIEQENSKLFKKGASLVKKTKTFAEVQKHPYYGKLSPQEQVKEAMAILIGLRGQELIEAFQSKPAAKSFKEWLQDLKNQLAKTFFFNKTDDINKMTLDEFLDGAVMDLLGGEHLGIKVRGATPKFQMSDTSTKVEPAPPSVASQKVDGITPNTVVRDANGRVVGSARIDVSTASDVGKSKVFTVSGVSFRSGGSLDFLKAVQKEARRVGATEVAFEGGVTSAQIRAAGMQVVPPKESRPVTSENFTSFAKAWGEAMKVSGVVTLDSSVLAELAKDDPLVTMERAEAEGQNVKGVRFLRRGDGEVYGATYINPKTKQREFYINPRKLTGETLIHETYHPFDAMMASAAKSGDSRAKAAINRLNALAREHGYMERVERSQAYSQESKETKEGEARTQMIADVANKSLDKTFLERLKKAIAEAVKWLASKFGVSLASFTPDEIAGMTLNDIVSASLGSARKGEFAANAPQGGPAIEYLTKADLKGDMGLYNLAVKYWQVLSKKVNDAKTISDIERQLNEEADSTLEKYMETPTSVSTGFVYAELMQLYAQSPNEYRGQLREYGIAAHPPVWNELKNRWEAPFTKEELAPLVKVYTEKIGGVRRQRAFEWRVRLTNFSPVERFMAAKGLSRFASKDKQAVPAQYFPTPFNMIMDKFRSSSNPEMFDWYKEYKAAVSEWALEDGDSVIEVKTENGISGKWIRMPKASESKNPAETVAKVQALSDGQTWCTNSFGAQKVIQHDDHDFYMFIPEGKISADLAIATIKQGQEGSLKQNPYYTGVFDSRNGSDNTVHPGYYDVVNELMRQTNDPDLILTLSEAGYSGLSAEEMRAMSRNKNARKIEFIENHTSEDFSSEEDMEILARDFGFRLEREGDKVAIEEITQGMIDQVPDEIHESFFKKLFNTITQIDGNARLSRVRIETLGKLEYVRGGLRIVANSYITNLGNLRYVGTLRMVGVSFLEDLGDLEVVKNTLHVTQMPELRNFGKLKFVGEDIIIRDCSNLETLGETVGLMDITITDNPKLKDIGKTRSLAKITVEHNDSLETLGEHLKTVTEAFINNNSSLKSLGGLEYARVLRAENNNLQDLGDYTLGENITIIDEPNLKTLGRMKYSTGMMFLSRTGIENLGSLNYADEIFLYGNDNLKTVAVNPLHVGEIIVQGSPNLASLGEIISTERLTLDHIPIDLNADNQDHHVFPNDQIRSDVARIAQSRNSASVHQDYERARAAAEAALNEFIRKRYRETHKAAVEMASQPLFQKVFNQFNEVLDLVEQLLASGFSFEEIYRALVAEGYPEKMVAASIRFREIMAVDGNEAFIGMYKHKIDQSTEAQRKYGQKIAMALGKLFPGLKISFTHEAWNRMDAERRGFSVVWTDGKEVAFHPDYLSPNTAFLFFSRAWLSSALQTNPDLLDRLKDLVDAEAGTNQRMTNDEYITKLSEMIANKALDMKEAPSAFRRKIRRFLADAFEAFVSPLRRVGIWKWERTSSDQLMSMTLEDLTTMIAEEITLNRIMSPHMRAMFDRTVASHNTYLNVMRSQLDSEYGSTRHAIFLARSAGVDRGKLLTHMIAKLKMPKDLAESMMDAVDREINHLNRVTSIPMSDTGLWGIINDARLFFTEEHVYIRKLQQAIKKINGHLNLDMKAEELFTLLNSRINYQVQNLKEYIYGIDTGSWFSLSDRTSTFRKRGVKKNSLNSRLRKAGFEGGVTELGMFMYALHAPERNARMKEQSILKAQKKRLELQGKLENATSDRMRARYQNELNLLDANELPGYEIVENGSRMSNHEAQMILDKYTPEQRAKLEEFAKEFRENVINKNLQVLLQYGLLTQERYDALINGTKEGSNVVWRHYVPLHIDNVFFNKEFGHFGSDTASPNIHAAEGRGPYTKDMVVNPVVQATLMLAKTYHNTRTNEAYAALVRLIQSNPDPKVAIVHRPRPIFQDQALPDNDKLLGEHDHDSGETTGKELVDMYLPDGVAERSIRVNYDGKIVYLELVHEGLRGLIEKQETNAAIETLTRIARSVTNVQRAIITVLNPFFALPNLERDLLEALQNISVQVDEYKLKGAGRKILGHIPSVMAFLTRKEFFNKEGQIAGQFKKLAKYIVEFEENGVPMSWSTYDGAREQIARLQEISDKHRKGLMSVEEYPKAVLHALFDTLLGINSILEMTVRFSSYAVLRDAGVSPTESAAAVKNLTLNFEMKGNSPFGHLISAMYMFSRVGAKGVVRGVQSLKTRNGRLRVLAWLTIGFWNKALLFLFTDDDDKDKLRAMGDYKWDNNLVIFNPFSPSMPTTIAKPYSVPRFALSIGEAAYDVAAGEKTALHAASDVAHNINAVFNPITGSQPNYVSALAPVIVENFVEVRMNEQWNGAPIYPKFSEGKADHEVYHKTTPEMYVETARKLYDDHGIDVSPETIRYVVEEMTGGVVAEMSRIAAYSGEETPISETPLLRRKFIDLSESDSHWAFVLYKNIDRLPSTKRITEKEKHLIWKAYQNAVEIPDEPMVNPHAARLIRDIMWDKFEMDITEPTYEGAKDASVLRIKKETEAMKKAIEKDMEKMKEELGL